VSSLFRPTARWIMSMQSKARSVCYI